MSYSGRTIEYGLLILSGNAVLDGEAFASDEFAFLGQGSDHLRLDLSAGSQVLLLGGEPFAQPVLMWWNFVGFSKAGIAEAQRQWISGDPRFGTVGDGCVPRLMPPLPWRDY